MLAAGASLRRRPQPVPIAPMPAPANRGARVGLAGGARPAPATARTTPAAAPTAESPASDFCQHRRPTPEFRHQRNSGWQSARARRTGKSRSRSAAAASRCDLSMIGQRNGQRATLRGIPDTAAFGQTPQTRRIRPAAGRIRKARRPSDRRGAFDRLDRHRRPHDGRADQNRSGHDRRPGRRAASHQLALARFEAGEEEAEDEEDDDDDDDDDDDADDD